MPLPSSGRMRMGADINVELGNSATAQISLGAAAPRALAGVPSGAIRLAADFYGKASAFIFNQTISSNTNDYNLRNAAIAAGWDQVLVLQATVTINSGVFVGSSSTGSAAFQTGSGFPAGSTLSIINNGSIVGRGGNGGSAGASGSTTLGSAGGGGAGVVNGSAGSAGNVGGNAAEILENHGHKIIAISDSKGAIYKESGINIKELNAYKKANGQIAGFTDSKNISNSELLELECDVLIQSALENQITKENANNIKAKLVIELANGPTTPEADDIQRA